MNKFLIILFLSTISSFATDFYLDNAASGANDGSSWTDAWQSVSDINWTAIADGDDTIYVSGGSESKSYTDQGALSGTFHYWLIEEAVTIKKSQEAGHNGTILWDSKISIAADDVVIDGRVSDLNYSTIYMDNLDAIKDNCGWKITESYNNGVAIQGDANSGVEVLGLEIAECGLSAAATSHGISHNINGGQAIADTLIQGCWIYYCRNDGVNITQNEATGYGGMVVDHCIIEYNGDDGVQVAAGVDVAWSSVGEPIPPEKGSGFGHPDAIQWAGEYTRIYNCLVRGTDAACIYGEMTWQDDEIDAIKGDVLIYGNIIYDPGGKEPNTGAQFGMQWTSGGGGASTEVTLDNYVAVHNTIYGTIANQPAIATLSDTEFTSITLTDVFFSNNLIYNTGNQSIRVGDLPPAGNDNFETFAESEVRVDYNIGYGTSDGIDWDDTAYDTMAAFNAATTFANNTSSQPVFEDLDDDDVRLAAEDTVAKDAGIALSGYIEADILANMPDYNTDLYGTSRTADGNPDIGALEYRSPTLAVYLDFEDSPADGQFDDESGNGNHGMKYGFPSGSPARWPGVTTVTLGSLSSQAGDFDYFYDGYGTYGKSGDYVAIEDFDGGDASTATIMCWAKYAPNTIVGSDGNYTEYNNSAILSNGEYSEGGGWSIGHQNTYASDVNIRDTKFIFWTDADHANRSQMTFGDTNNADGSTDAMAHYAVTFNAGVINIYYNGEFVSTETVSQTTIRLDTTTNWLGIGGGPHHGSAVRDAWLEEDGYGPYDEYPNWRWFHGQIDNVRIYTSALNALEIAEIYEAEGGGEESLPSYTGPTRLDGTGRGRALGGTGAGITFYN